MKGGRRRCRCGCSTRASRWPARSSSRSPYDDPDQKLAGTLGPRAAACRCDLPNDGVWLVKAVHMVPVVGNPARRLAQHLGLADVRGPGRRPVEARVMRRDARRRAHPRSSPARRAAPTSSARSASWPGSRRAARYEIDAIVDREHLPPGFGASAAIDPRLGTIENLTPELAAEIGGLVARRDRRRADRLRRNAGVSRRFALVAAGGRAGGGRLWRPELTLRFSGEVPAGREDLHLVERRAARHLHADDPDRGRRAGRAPVGRGPGRERALRR